MRKPSSPTFWRSLQSIIILIFQSSSESRKTSTWCSKPTYSITPALAESKPRIRIGFPTAVGGCCLAGRSCHAGGIVHNWRRDRITSPVVSIARSWIFQRSRPATDHRQGRSLPSHEWPLIYSTPPPAFWTPLFSFYFGEFFPVRRGIVSLGSKADRSWRVRLRRTNPEYWNYYAGSTSWWK